MNYLIDKSVNFCIWINFWRNLDPKSKANRQIKVYRKKSQVNKIKANENF